MTPKELAKFATLCRKAGIKQYKCADFEFTLSDYAPEVATRARRIKTLAQPKESNYLDPVGDGWDSLSDEQKLFYSSTPMETTEEQ